MDALRAEVRAAFGGRAPRVLDPFAGGGAIPLEAMRLGCEAVAADVNPVARFILRCTFHYPRRTAGEGRALPGFALRDRGFMEAFLKAHGLAKPAALRAAPACYGHGEGEPAADAPLLEAPDPAKPERRRGRVDSRDPPAYCRTLAAVRGRRGRNGSCGGLVMAIAAIHRGRGRP